MEQTVHNRLARYSYPLLGRDRAIDRQWLLWFSLARLLQRRLHRQRGQQMELERAGAIALDALRRLAPSSIEDSQRRWQLIRALGPHHYDERVDGLRGVRAAQLLQRAVALPAFWISRLTSLPSRTLVCRDKMQRHISALSYVVEI